MEFTEFLCMMASKVINFFCKIGSSFAWIITNRISSIHFDFQNKDLHNLWTAKIAQTAKNAKTVKTVKTALFTSLITEQILFCSIALGFCSFTTCFLQYLWFTLWFLWFYLPIFAVVVQRLWRSLFWKSKWIFDQKQ